MAATSAASGLVAPDAAFGAASAGTAGEAFGGASDDIAGKALDGVAGLVAEAIVGLIFGAGFGGTACSGNSAATIITGGGGAGCGSGASQTVASRTT